jgi:hypothetical protein
MTSEERKVLPLQGPVHQIDDATVAQILEHVFGLLQVLEADVNRRRGDTPRQRVIRQLHLLAKHLNALGASEAVTEPLLQLGIALEDLEDGIVPDILAPASKSKKDQTATWQAKEWIALGLEFFYQAGLSREAAVQEIRMRWPAIALVAGDNPKRNLRYWYDAFMDGAVSNDSVRKAFKEVYGILDPTAPRTVEERREFARFCLQRATKLLGVQ